MPFHVPVDQTRGYFREGLIESVVYMQRAQPMGLSKQISFGKVAAQTVKFLCQVVKISLNSLLSL